MSKLSRKINDNMMVCFALEIKLFPNEKVHSYMFSFKYGGFYHQEGHLMVGKLTFTGGESGGGWGKSPPVY